MFRIIFRRRVRRAVRRRRRAADYPDYKARKEDARKLVMSRLEHFVREYERLDPLSAAHMEYARVAIRNTRSRWGSCSSRKNLNFNYKLLDLAPELRDYVIVHELCHLKELHHGKAFWELIGKIVPDPRELGLQVRNENTIMSNQTAPKRLRCSY